jgi:uncharacterized protein (TIGR02145 family)
MDCFNLLIIKMKKYIFSSVLVVFYVLTTLAQVGIGTTTPNANAALEVASTTQGMLFPRMTTTERDAISSPAKGLTIYNTTLNLLQTNTGTSGTPIWKIWDGRNSTTNGTAIVSGYTCATAFAGTMIAGTAVSGVRQIITATVTTVGTYSITTTTANGVTFSATGTFAGTGAQNITLTATGTPTAAGSTTFTLNTTPNCNFSRTTNHPSSNGTAIVSGYTCATASAGTMTAGTAVSGVTQTITATVTTVGTYSITTTTANGVTFSATGTFAGTGAQTITLTATGRPTAVGSTTFTLNTTPNCNFSRTTNQPSSNGTAIVSAYTCATASAGTMTAGTAVSGVTQTITATVTTVGTYSITTTTANGVTFSATGTFAGTGAQTITLTATGTPTAGGSTTFTLNTTPNCNFSWNTITPPSYAAGSVFCTSGATAVVNVTNPTTNKIWMDRNLGATQVATSSADADSYGDLYQWGRRADGHQCRTSVTTTLLSTTDQPPNGKFILAPFQPSDWRSPQNTNLWQGVNGVNKPCPSGYRLPTEAEWEAERQSWSFNNSYGASASPLKLPVAGARGNNDGMLGVGTEGFYWSSTFSDIFSRLYKFASNSANMTNYSRAWGLSVRCIKD